MRCASPRAKTAMSGRSSRRPGVTRRRETSSEARRRRGIVRRSEEGRMYIGAHVKSSGGVWNAIANGVQIGCEAVQFFAGSPRTWAPTLYKDKDAAKFREARDESPIRFVVIHTIYLINLASAKEDFYEKSVTSLLGAVAAADQLGADAIVTHVGSHQGAGFDVGLARVQAALRRVFALGQGSPVRILLENTAGAGGTMGIDFDELGATVSSTHLTL